MSETPQVTVNDFPKSTLSVLKKRVGTVATIALVAVGAHALYTGWKREEKPETPTENPSA